MACNSLNAEQLSELRSQIRQLIKFVALNYLAVVKAIKKRNRHCKVGTQFGGCSMRECINFQLFIAAVQQLCSTRNSSAVLSSD